MMPAQRVRRLPPNPSDTPTVSKTVLEDLKRLDPDLHLQFSHYMVSGIDGSPLIANETGEPIPYPRWNLWIRGGDGYYRRVLILQTPNEEYLPPDGRLVKALEQHPARYLSPKEMYLREVEKREAQKAKALREHEEKKRDFVSANKRRIQEVMERPFDIRKDAVEDGKIVSYGSQTKRSRTSERPSDPSTGWENPWSD